MICALDVTDPETAKRLLVIQHAAYAVEAELIGFDGIPPLHEDLAGLMSSTEHWLGRYRDDVLVGAVAYELPDLNTLEISRLVIDPAYARQGHARALLDHLDLLEPRPTTLVSTGSANTPAVALYLSRAFTETSRSTVASGVQLTHFARTASPSNNPPARPSEREPSPQGGPLMAWTSGPLQFRAAGPDDAERIAALHADSWRRHYRGAYADSFLDGDIATERRSVWSKRLAAPADTATVLAEDDDRLAGFVHVMFDDDPRWGSLVDNLHVHHRQRRTGIGTRLLTRAAQAVTEGAAGNAMYLWVLEQNTAAQQFYLATGATCVETGTVPPPGGDPSRLNGSPICLRMSWPDASLLSEAVDDH